MGLEAGTTRNLNRKFLLLGGGVFFWVSGFDFFCMLVVTFLFLQVWSILIKISVEGQAFLERKEKGDQINLGILQ